MKRSPTTIALVLAALGAGCVGGASTDSGTASQAVVAGAGYTTFEVNLDGCLDSPNGVNCNNYESKEHVYMSGGPVKAGLSDGDYYFAVLAPGYQNGGFLDGAEGNLSDTTAGGTEGDLGRGDEGINRMFRVIDHDVVAYSGTHLTGYNPTGHFVIGLSPFDDTDNEGGVYILAICAVGAESPSDCKYDAFRIRGGETEEFCEVSGAKYYDANTNGMLDGGEELIAGWPIAYSDGVSGVIHTGEDGTFSVELTADSYYFWELLPVAGSTWMQTGNLVDQSYASGGARAQLLPNKAYDVVAVDGGVARDLYFGNVCLGAGGGHTLGFWSNKNGRALFDANDLALMRALSLRTFTGGHFDPVDYNAFRAWLLDANATNMAYMLSAQLAAMELNAANDLVDHDSLVYAPGVEGANTNGFISVRDLMTEANDSLTAYGYTLAGHPERPAQEALKNALDAANNNRTFVQPTPATCPAPVFP